MIDLAVIGAGAIAQGAYLPAIDAISDARIRWIIDLDEERAQYLADHFDADDVATDYASVVDSVDAAVISTPPQYHADIAEAFLDAGSHVFTEKPVATESARGWDLVESARETDVHYAISRQLRESPACRNIRTFCDNNVIGQPSEVHIRFGDETHWDFASDYRLREELAWGGVLTDKAPHVLDLLYWIFGSDTNIVRYQDDSLGGLEANAEIELTVGAEEIPASVEVTADRDITNTILVRGDAGTVRGNPNDGWVRLRDETGEEMVLETDDQRLTRFRPRVANQLERFVTAINGGPNGYVPAEAGVRLVEWIEACYRERESLEYPWEQRPLRDERTEVLH